MMFDKELSKVLSYKFSEGEIDTYDDHSILNTCDRFDMRNSVAQDLIMSLNHEGKYLERHWEKLVIPSILLMSIQMYTCSFVYL